MGLIVYQGEKSTMVGFDSRLVEAELMCLKSFTNVPHIDRATPTENWCQRIGVRTLALKRYWHLPNDVIMCQRF